MAFFFPSTRSADVTLKEGRKLVILVRETPLHLGHLRNMEKLAEMGAVILQPVPAFYHRLQTIQELIDHTIGKILDIFDIEHNLFPRAIVSVSWHLLVQC